MEHTIKATVISAERLKQTANGQPRFRVGFQNRPNGSDHMVTRPDSHFLIAYVPTVGDDVTITYNGRNQITNMEKN